MSDIRFNQWLHQSGTGGVTQLSSGHVGIGTTNPLIPVHSGNNAVLNVGVVTANNIYAGTLNGTLALSDISGITGSFTSDLTVNGPNLDISDKIRHIGDTNTAIRFPANDTVTIETNGSAKFHIDSTGRISSGNHGVGTYNDASEWFKVQSNNSAANISIVGSNATHSSLNLGDEDDFNIQKIRSDHTNNSLQFFTDNTERFRIDSTGRMFLGLTSSSYPKRLNIQGSSGSIIALNNNDTTSYAADTNTSIEFGLNTGNTGNQNGSCEIRAFKENGTNGNNARGLSFYTGGNGGSPAKRLVIHSEGYVTKPYQPSFHVSRRGGDVSGNNYVTFDHVDYNNGNHYSNSTGRFTAPVTGIYFFSAWHYTGSTSAFYLRINTATFGEYAWDDTGGCATWVCPMTANQYAQIYTKYTWRGSADYHNGFNGYLIG